MTFEDMQEIKGENQGEKVDLDRYGVWVKKPPQTIVDTQNSVSKDNCDKPEIAEAVPEVQIPVMEQASPTNDSLGVTPELEESFDLPDFDNLEAAELTSVPDFAETPVQDTVEGIEMASTEEPPVLDISQELEESFDIPEMDNIEAADLPPIPEEFSTSTIEEPVIPETPAQIDIPDVNEISPEAAAFMSDAPSFDDGEISLDSFFSESSSTESVDLSDFGDGEISLDSFFDSDDGGEISVDAFMPKEKKVKNDIVDDPPMDIQLSFDDDFVLNTKADPTRQMESFDGDSFDFSDEASFDAMFDDIVDESPSYEPTEDTLVPDFSKSSATSSSSTEDISFDEVTEFDDLLSDEFTAVVAQDTSESSLINRVVDYDITVSMDDEDIQEVKSIQTDTEDDDTVEDISLYMDTPTPENSDENKDSSLDRTQSSSYTTTYSSDDEDFDLDKIMSEVEVIGGEEMEGDFNQDEKKTIPQEQMDMNSDFMTSTPPDIFDDDFFETEPKAEETPSDDFFDVIVEPEKEQPVEPVVSPIEEENSFVQDESATIDDFAMPEESAITDDFAMPEESASAEDFAMPEETAITDDFAMPEESAITDDFAMPEESATADDFAMPEESATIDDFAMPEESATTDDFAMPEESATTDDFAMPEETATADDFAMPEESATTEDFAMPEETATTEDFAMPEESATADDFAMPEETASADDFAMPEESAITDDFAMPEETASADEPTMAYSMEEAVPEIQEEENFFEDENREVDIQEPVLSEEIDNSELPTDYSQNTTDEVLQDDNNDETMINNENITNDDMDLPVEEEMSDFEEPTMVDLQEPEDNFYASSQDETKVSVLQEEPENKEMLNTIAEELASLRKEISSMKNSLESLKTNGIEAIAPETVEEETQEEVSNESAFFEGSTDDDTIALSGDELSNILNTADFTEEEGEEISTETAIEEESTAESYQEAEETVSDEITVEDSVPEVATSECYQEVDETVSEETPSSEINLYSDDSEEIEDMDMLPKMDFDSEQLEEPDDIDFGIEPELPEEIEVPVSEETDSQENFQEPEINEANFEDSQETTNVASVPLSFAALEDDTETVSDEEIAVLESDVLEEETPAFEEPVVAQDEITTEEDEETEEVEEEISDEPTEEMFKSNQWEEENGLAVEEPTDEITEPVEEVIATDENASQDDSFLEPVEIDEEPEVFEEPELAKEPEEILMTTGAVATAAVVGMVAASSSAEDDTLCPVEEVPEAEEEIPEAEELIEVEEASDVVEETPSTAETIAAINAQANSANIPDDLKKDIKSVLSYMDQLLDNLPEEKIAEFAHSEHFELYKKLFTELGLS